jgi:hypothetical protein
MVHLVQSAESPYYSPFTKIILITPPPVNTHQRVADLASRDPPLELDRLFDTTKQYAEGVKEAAAASKVAAVDVWTVIWKAVGENEEALARYLSDGLHLNADGYTVSSMAGDELFYLAESRSCTTPSWLPSQRSIQSCITITFNTFSPRSWISVQLFSFFGDDFSLQMERNGLGQPFGAEERGVE